VTVALNPKARAMYDELDELARSRIEADVAANGLTMAVLDTSHVSLQSLTPRSGSNQCSQHAYPHAPAGPSSSSRSC
jgi:hypothetical protein